MYVRGVAIVAPVDIDIDIDIPRLVCLLSLFCCSVLCPHGALRCRQTIDPKARHLYSYMLQFFVDGCRLLCQIRLLVAVAVAVGWKQKLRPIYKYCSLVEAKNKTLIANLGECLHA